MQLKLLVIISIFFIKNPSFGQYTDSLIHYNYRLTIKNNIKLDPSMEIGLEANVTVLFEIFTNKKQYLITPIIEDLKIENGPIPKINQKNEAIIIDVTTNKVFFLSDKTFSNYKPIILKKYSTSTSFYVNGNNDSIMFLQDQLYENAITPFPYYICNSFGIKNVYSRSYKCELIMEEKVDKNDEFLSCLNSLKNFTDTHSFFEFPY